MPGITSILSIGKSGLFASQASIEVTGQNIANVDTEGYSRQRVRLETGLYIDYAPGQLGTGVVAAEVQRYFDEFVESQYNDKASARERYLALYNAMTGVETLFNESSIPGISTSMNQFFSDWTNLSLDPENYAKRQVLIEDTQNLISLLEQTDGDLRAMQAQMDEYIAQDVEEINQLAEDIAELNRQITQHDVPGTNNANGLYDSRDLKIRRLAELTDINVIDNGSGELTVETRAGQTIVDGMVTFEFKFEYGDPVTQLSHGSTFDGKVYFEGNDEFEYTLEVVTAGEVSNAASAMFRVSLDGGESWLKNEDGTEQRFPARPSDGKVQVGDLSIWFGDSSNPDNPPADINLSAGDKFTIVPKKALYWYKSAGTQVNATPQILQNGQDDATRLTGGSLAGYFNFRDAYVGRYRDQLNELTESLAWEVNRVHSQGTGLEPMTFCGGTYSVQDPDTALGSDSSGLTFSSRLQAGQASMYFYDTTGALVSGGAIDFSGVVPPGLANFDPSVHDLNDVVSAVNATHGTYVTAAVVNDRLTLTANSGYSFAFGNDSAGLFAGLGVNTFFEGSSASDLAVNAAILTNSNFLNTGHVNGAGEMNSGDNTTALALAGLQNQDVSMGLWYQGKTSQTLGTYYDSLVGTVGVDTSNVKFQSEFQAALAKQLNDQQLEVSGVSLDEEMTNLIKFQHSYRAAAKLITTADEMFQTVLGLKS